MKHFDELKEQFIETLIDDDYNLIEFLGNREELNELVAEMVYRLDEEDFKESWEDYGYDTLENAIESLDEEEEEDLEE